MKYVATAVALSQLLLVGCAGLVNDKEAEAAYRDIENRMLSASVLRVNYEIEASGAVTANLAGDLVTQKPEMAAISANGVFNHNVVQPRLVSDGVRMRGGIEADSFEEGLPVDLRAGLLLGMTRMGILHNLAMLAHGAPPQGTDGNVRDWVQAKAFAWQTATHPKTAALRGIGFELEVSGEPSGTVVLWYDPATGLPVEREQLVRFETGDMSVVERYSIETDGMIGPCRFDLDSIEP
ncbi:MAG: hypothetical protein OER80_11955 [Gammaproteobacteria bacterium]|nr:hypothetical protein [Gammaproteobacteria bacterium]